MIVLSNGTKLIQPGDSLPELFGVDELFLDVETNRVFDDKKHGGMYPFKGDRIAGVAVTADNLEDVWYVPARHKSLFDCNIPEDTYITWLSKVISTAKKWVNHNVVFDAMFCHFDGAEISPTCELVDTLTLCKLLDSDRLRYGLKTICREWLNIDMSEELDIKAYLKGTKSKSYGDVPADILGNYAGMDVLANRKLYRYLQTNLPEQLSTVVATETKLASLLYDMELRGLRIDRKEVMLDQLNGLRKLIQITTDLAELTNREFTNSSTCIYDLLINQNGLPILMTKWEKNKETGRVYNTGRPTFNKKALALYEVHPLVQASKKLQRLVKLIKDYRKESQHQNLFVAPFLLLADSYEYIHPRYNAIVRTGRMSCSRPNAQQQNKRSKRLIHPTPGYGFISCDYSQIEFRLIVHYIEDIDAIRAYRENPLMNFHQWIADLCGVEYKAGKTLNFMIGYGAGKRKVESELAANPSIIAAVSKQVAAEIKTGVVSKEESHLKFQELCQERAEDVYATYHERLPGVKRTSELCSQVCRQRGYIRTAYGRRRHLPTKVAHNAFNSLVQGCAMDLIKERLVALSPRENPWMVVNDIHIVASVHDEVLFEVPLDILYSPEVHSYLTSMLESPTVEFKVPIRIELGISENNWAEACGDEVLDGGGNWIAGKLGKGKVAA